jgi:predicted glycosyltransferase
MTQDGLRIILYSHDAMGIGHVRRNLRIARALTETGVAGRCVDALLISGVVEVGAFELPPHVDCLTLPSLRKRDNEHYEPRRLGFATERLVALRTATIAGAVRAFEPHAVIVDKLPHGVADELKPVINSLQPDRVTGRCRLILGLRDVLDAPDVVGREWECAGTATAIEQLYDGVWIYGDPAVYDTVREYGFPDAVAAKSRYTGYLRADCSATPARVAAIESLLNLGNASMFLCTVGGGEDGARLATAFARARLPEDAVGVIVTGPFMPAGDKRELHAIAAENPRLRVLDFVPDSAALLSRADRVITMGGYNTVCEVLSAGKPALIVPRVVPRREQSVRARRLAEMGLVSTTLPDAAGQHALEQWLALPNPPRPTDARRIDFDGLSRIPQLLAELLDAPAPAAGASRPPGVSISHKMAAMPRSVTNVAQ